MFGKSLTLFSLLAAKASATIWYAGVAESGGEFGVWSMLSSQNFSSTYTNNNLQARMHRLLDFPGHSMLIMLSLASQQLTSTSIKTKSVSMSVFPHPICLLEHRSTCSVSHSCLSECVRFPSDLELGSASLYVLHRVLNT